MNYTSLLQQCIFITHKEYNVRLCLFDTWILYSIYNTRSCLLIDYDVVRLCLRTAATNCPIIHPPDDMQTLRAMVMIPAGDNSWIVHQSSLAVLTAETSVASRRNGRRSENFAYQYLRYIKGCLTRRIILRHGTFPLYFPSERKVCCGFSSPLKIHRLCRV
jgi:hypothetical protein